MRPLIVVGGCVSILCLLTYLTSAEKGGYLLYDITLVLISICLIFAASSIDQYLLDICCMVSH